MSALWQGFDYRWRATPHRLNEMSSLLRGLEYERGELRGEQLSRFSVGKVPDQGLAVSFATPLWAPGMQWIEGRVEAVLAAAIGVPAAWEGPPVRLRLPGRVQRAEEVGLVLRGFELSCTSHAAGVHPRGFGLELARLEVEEGWLSFCPRAFVAASNSPDRFTADRGVYRYRLGIPYAVLLAPGRLHCTRAAVLEHTYGHPRQGLVMGQPRAGLAPRLELQGVPERFEAAAIGLHGLAWSLGERQPGVQAWSQRQGRFLRRLRSSVHDMRYDPATGRAEARIAARFSNRGTLSYGTAVEHQLWPTLIQLQGGWVGEARRLEARLPTGIGAGAERRQRFAWPLPEDKS